MRHREHLFPFPPKDGDRYSFDGIQRVYYGGFWVRTYPVPADTLGAKKKLIQSMTRRLFNHVEHGIDVSGERLDEIRKSYDSESEPHRKRVKAGMLAGCLLNRAVDIFRAVVELQQKGISISYNDPLMQTCGRILVESMNLGRDVRHRSGEDGLDELWGEPFRAFSVPLEHFYETRYIKISQAMRDISDVCSIMRGRLSFYEEMSSALPFVDSLESAAFLKCETLRTDEGHFDAWSSLTCSMEELSEFGERLAHDYDNPVLSALFSHILKGRDLVFYLSRVRAPMRTSVERYAFESEALPRILSFGKHHPFPFS